jgi:acetyl-CoA carboxylase biotin carboxyl carrier protein
MPLATDGVSSLLDLDHIRQLVDMMVANDLVEISIRNGDDEISLRRPNACAPPVMTVGPQVMQPPPIIAPSPDASSMAAMDKVESNLVEIGSPMVGTFYSAPDPNSPPFVQVGSIVHPGSVVCILEAMKVFNEIKAEVSGTIERVLAKNGQAVEYGQPLFLVRPGP